MKPIKWTVILLLVLSLTAALVLPACAPKVTEVGEEKGYELKVGQIGLLMGGAAAEGLDINRGVLDGVRWFNEKGGGLPGGGTVRVIVEDGKYDPAEETRVIKKFVEADGVVSIITCTTGGATACKEYVMDKKVPILHQSSPMPCFPEDKGYELTTFPTYTDVYELFVTWGYEQWQKAGKPGKPNIGIYAADYEFGRICTLVTKKKCEELDLPVAAVTFTSTNPVECTTQVRTLKKAGVDIVISPSISQPFTVYAKECALQDFHPFLNLFHLSLNTPSLLEAVGKDLVGAMCYCHYLTWDQEDNPGIAYSHELIKEWYPEVYFKGGVAPFWYFGWAQALVTCEALKLAVEKYGHEGFTGEQALKGFEMIKDFNGIGGEFCTISFAPGDHLGATETMLFKVMPDGLHMEPATDWLQFPELPPEKRCAEFYEE